MDYASVILFLALYYIRPQEWIGWVTVLKPVTWSMALALTTMLLRHRGLTFRDVFKMPHDWMMLAFFLWIVGSAPAPRQTMGAVYNVFVFYVVTVQCLSTMKRVQSFLNWWAVMIFIVAVLALASEYGFDPMQSKDVTQFLMKGRLVLNTSIFNNPNALGHSVVPVVFMLYYTLFWKQPVFAKIGSIPIMCLPLYCIYLTISKGAFVSGFGMAAITMALGRPKVVQLLTLIVALTIGWAALLLLPRMEEINEAGTDEAIRGRVEAFKWGLHNFETRTAGVGFGRFKVTFVAAHGYVKASHSAYNQIGCELGYPGLYLFLAIVYYSLRTLITARTHNIQEERVRRILFVLILAYLISSWMVDFAFRATFFLFTAAIAAFHRLLVQSELSETDSISERTLPLTTNLVGTGSDTAPALANADLGFTQPAAAIPETTAVLSPQDESKSAILPPRLNWNRVHWFDFVIIALMTVGTVRFWEYVISVM